MISGPSISQGCPQTNGGNDQQYKEGKLVKYHKKIQLKDGRTCVLRNGTASDGQAVLEVFNLTHGQTDWLLSYADENSFNAEQEADFLQTKTDSPDEIEILAEIDGRVVGTAGIEHVGTKDKVKHRAEFGISVDEDFWGLGIGRALTRACVECAKEAGYAQVELDVTAQNDRAIALYESEGFVEYGRNPKGFRSRFTGWQELVLMRLDLEKLKGDIHGRKI